MQRNQVCQKQLTRSIGRIAKFYEVFMANSGDKFAYPSMGFVSYICVSHVLGRLMVGSTYLEQRFQKDGESS